MEKFLKIVVTLAAIAIIVMVRLHRALESALWEICPGAMTWTRNVVDAAHKAVCQEQREAIESRRTSAPKPKKLKPAVKPVSELPSVFPSIAAWQKAVKESREVWQQKCAARNNISVTDHAAYTDANTAVDRAWDEHRKVLDMPIAR